ncbi:MAG: DUF5060 domain-containing protein [Bacteroidia bacterium]
MIKVQHLVLWLCSCLTLSLSTLDAQTLTSLSLVNPANGSDYLILTNGTVIDLANYASNSFNIRAYTQPDPTGSVRFAWAGQNNFSTESVAPYALFGDNNGNYAGQALSIGSYSITATPYSGANAGGNTGTPLTLNFSVINSGAPPTGNCSGAGTGQVSLSGELRQWHKITLDFGGPSSDESCSTNPFLDYRLNVLFTHTASGNTYLVPGFFAADGQAEETSATGGSVWRCHFAPDATGTWTYTASFRTGNQIAVSLNPSDGSPTAFDGQNGSFSLAATNKTGRDFRAHGRLEYVGERYLKFAGSGQYFIKGGADAPENLLAYEDFDNTPNNGNRRKNWTPHLIDWNVGDPDWQSGKGRELVGALNYLAGKGMNVFSFLTMNINGDDRNVFPYVNSNGSTSPQDDRQRFDVSKLAQWEVLFAHADQLGLYLHFKTQETENDQLLDQGQLGVERKLYYRELIARFGHHLALNWNLGEENDIWSELNDPTQLLIKSYADYIRSLDPYDHHIVIHSYPGQQNSVYNPLLGTNSALTGASIQTGWNNVHSATKTWIDASTNAGTPWVVANDEQGNANNGVPPDIGFEGFSLPSNTPDQEAIRRGVLWGNLMAGGAGVEYYFGYSLPHSDLTCQNWRSRDQMWEYTDHALSFFRDYLPFWEMQSEDNLVSSGYCFAKSNEYYAIYIENGNAPPSIELPNSSFDLRWYDPRNGGALIGSSTISGSSSFALPASPNAQNDDWIVLLTNSAISFPVELNYFEGERLAGGQVSLRWESLQEVNTLRFEIESSADGIEQQLEMIVLAAGNSDIPIAYQSTLSSPHDYFRLKTVDIDGQFAYTHWLKLSEGDERVLLVPNPFDDQIELKVPASYLGSQIKIYDLLGREVEAPTTIHSLAFGLPMESLGQGIYVLVITQDNTRLFQKRLMKN